jgi:AcrR family transcriptional regulator
LRIRYKPPRRRRRPEDARREILGAAERVFARHQPGDVGLVNVAREAGVSHALITHYFKTYRGLVEAALELRVRALRETVEARLREAGALSRPQELLGILFATLGDPVHLKLMKWLLAAERVEPPTFALRDRGLKDIAKQIASALPAGIAKQREIELSMATAVAAAFGYALAKPALAAALGRKAGSELDSEIQHTLTRMLQAYLRETVSNFGGL